MGCMCSLYLDQAVQGQVRYSRSSVSSTGSPQSTKKLQSSSIENIKLLENESSCFTFQLCSQLLIDKINGFYKGFNSRLMSTFCKSSGRYNDLIYTYNGHSRGSVVRVKT
jgi:hypothetical protein